MVQMGAHDLQRNQLRELPPEIARLNNLTTLDLGGNPLPDALLAAYKRGLDDLRTYLGSLAEDAEALYEAKLVFVDEGGVGKSSLLAAMCGEAFQEGSSAESVG